MAVYGCLWLYTLGPMGSVTSYLPDSYVQVPSSLAPGLLQNLDGANLQVVIERQRLLSQRPSL